MFKVVLTGLIGAGKSTAALVFRTIGIPCYDTDSNAKRLMAGQLRPEIESLLGTESFNEDGSMDRKYIAGRIFNDSVVREKLNGIVHPAVKEDFIKWAERHDSPYVMAETALLLESGFDRICDKIILVTADVNERIMRTILRDSTDRESVVRRIEAQENEGRLIEMADFVIDNDERSAVIPQVLRIHKNIVTFADEKKEKI